MAFLPDLPDNNSEILGSADSANGTVTNFRRNRVPTGISCFVERIFKTALAQVAVGVRVTQNDLGAARPVRGAAAKSEPLVKEGIDAMGGFTKDLTNNPH